MPVIRAVMSGDGGSMTAAQMNELNEEIYNAAKGCESMCSFFVQDTNYFNAHFATLGYSTITVGGTTGFKVKYVADNRDSRYQLASSMELYYNNSRISTARVWSGYNTFEYAFLIMYTDENYNLIVSTTNGYPDIYVRNNTHIWDTYMKDDIPYSKLLSGGNFIARAGDCNFTITSNNIRDKVKKEIDPSETDPYAPEGPAETGGGDGDFDTSSDSNPVPSDPAISATDTGFMTVFATNLAGIQSLSNSLWADIFPDTLAGQPLHDTVEALKNIVASPYDAILGCHIVPVTVPVGSSKNVKLYGVLPSSVSLPVAASQWVTKDCGTLDIKLIDGSYLDYAPYTKVTSLYLPFVGVVSVDTDIIMGQSLGVTYKIDIISGQCIAFVTVNGDVKFQYQGQCAVPLPVTSIDWSTTVSAGLGIVGSVASIAGSAVGGALGGGGAAGALAGSVKGLMGEAGSIAQNVMNSKPDIKSGGGIGGSAALMGCKYPYLIMERPKKSNPTIRSGGSRYSQNHWTGYPSNIAARLGDLSGYTEVARIFVNRTNATADEKEEIERLLSEGVYI